MTTQGVFPITIKATPDDVWTWVGDLSRHPRWSPRPYSVECVSGQPNEVGSRYRSVGWIPGDKNHPNDVEITEVVPASRLVLRADDAQGAFMNTYTLRPVDAGTEVEFTLVFPPMTGINAIMVPILFPLVGKADIRKRMVLLKELVESTTGEGPGDTAT
jgi:uncharacterized protein YndB with AHSA1/START domain